MPTLDWYRYCPETDHNRRWDASSVHDLLLPGRMPAPAGHGCASLRAAGSQRTKRENSSQKQRQQRLGGEKTDEGAGRRAKGSDENRRCREVGPVLRLGDGQCSGPTADIGL